METCVLIPQEFALAVTGLGARNSRDQTATVWSNTAIPQGTLCYPFQGTVRIDNLDVYSYVDEDDVSTDPFHYLDGGVDTPPWAACELRRRKLTHV